MNEPTDYLTPFHQYVGTDDDQPDTLCAACGVRKDRAIHDANTAARHGGFQPLAPQNPPLTDSR